MINFNIEREKTNIEGILKRVREQVCSHHMTESNIPHHTDLDASALTDVQELSPRLAVYLEYIQQHCASLGHEIGFEKGSYSKFTDIDGITVTKETAFCVGEKKHPLGEKFEVRISKTFVGKSEEDAHYSSYPVNTGSRIYYGVEPSPSGYLEDTGQRLCTFLAEEGYLSPSRRGPAPANAVSVKAEAH